MTRKKTPRVLLDEQSGPRCKEVGKPQIRPREVGKMSTRESPVTNRRRYDRQSEAAVFAFSCCSLATLTHTRPVLNREDSTSSFLSNCRQPEQSYAMRKKQNVELSGERASPSAQPSHQCCIARSWASQRETFSREEGGASGGWKETEGGRDAPVHRDFHGKSGRMHTGLSRVHTRSLAFSKESLNPWLSSQENAAELEKLRRLEVPSGGACFLCQNHATGRESSHQLESARVGERACWGRSAGGGVACVFLLCGASRFLPRPYE